MGEKKEYVLFSNWHFKRNVLGNIIVLRNRCTNLCPEKCTLGKVPMQICSEPLEVFPVSSSTGFLWS